MERNDAIKVGMISLGCNKNQVDAELMLGTLAREGFIISDDQDNCDVIIVNTCGFIESAKKESIENILECCRLKDEGKIKLVVVTGCLAERYSGSGRNSRHRRERRNCFRYKNRAFRQKNCLLLRSGKPCDGGRPYFGQRPALCLYPHCGRLR